MQVEILWILQAQQLTGVAVPSYYNPAAVNPLKYAEQLKKRKMLWSKAGKETTDKEKEVEMNLYYTVVAVLILSVNFAPFFGLDFNCFLCFRPPQVVEVSCFGLLC